jgi:hypothetical protein
VLIVVYNQFWGRWPRIDLGACAAWCSSSTDRHDLRRADAVVFHLPTLDWTSMPRRRRGQRWVAYSMESDVTVPAMRDPERMALFDLTMTYQRSADVWVPYVSQARFDAMLRPLPAKTADWPVVHFQSNPYDRSGRNAYLHQLMRHIKVASYGTVLSTAGHDVVGREAQMEVYGRHKLALAFENSIATDYVSDKLYDPLCAGTVPIYLGTRSVADLTPHPDSYIDVADFDDPAELAAYIDHLDRDADAYAAHHAWRETGATQQFLDLLASTPEPFERLAQLLAR